ncbi:MAG: hypothetical protein K2K53_02975 [Oscillospiraceae bacterium]|nr:hypothetical protein [Oscillospiraceae bacterium]
MKRMVFGILLTLIGLLFFAFCFIHAILNPVSLNDVEGLVPFILSFVVMCAGLVICGWEAFHKDK